MSSAVSETARPPFPGAAPWTMKAIPADDPGQASPQANVWGGYGFRTFGLLWMEPSHAPRHPRNTSAKAAPMDAPARV